jgi:hypothetical protein
MICYTLSWYAKYNSQAADNVPHNICITVIIDKCMRITRFYFSIYLQSLRKTTKTSEYETEYHKRESSERIILKFTL